MCLRLQLKIQSPNLFPINRILRIQNWRDYTFQQQPVDMGLFKKTLFPYYTRFLNLIFTANLFYQQTGKSKSLLF